MGDRGQEAKPLPTIEDLRRGVGERGYAGAGASPRSHAGTRVKRSRGE